MDDIVEGVKRVMQAAPEKKNGEDGLTIPPYAVYNIWFRKLPISNQMLFLPLLFRKYQADSVHLNDLPTNPLLHTFL